MANLANSGQINNDDEYKQQLLDTKETLLATVSHEIRTPLNAIIGITELLHSSTSLTTDQQEYVDVIHKCSDQLLLVINDLLDYSKCAAKKMALVQAEFDLISLIDECIDTINVQAFKKQLNIYKNIDPNMPEFIIGDEKRIKQVLLNILSNAVKFTSKGSVTLKAYFKDIVANTHNEDEKQPPISNEDDYKLIYENTHKKLNIIFEIIDTGIGITKEKQQLIFDSFYQLNNPKWASSTNEGTGLGLAISKHLINLHGGEIMVSSEPNIGSKFTFNFIVYSSNTRIDYITEYFAKKKVLIVDDDETNRMLCLHTFISWDFKPIIATNNAETQLLLNLHNFDLVIMDIQMKNNSGIEIATIIRQKHKNIRIIALSSMGFVNKSIHDKIFDYQAVKPVKKHLLYNMLLCLFAPKNKHKQSSNDLLSYDNDTNINNTDNNNLRIDPMNAMNSTNATNALNQTNTIHQNTECNNKNIGILVAEDSKLNQLVITKMLQQLKYSHIEIAENGIEVLDKIRQNHYDVLLLDLKMPLMDGYETVYKLQNEFKKETLPIIIAQTAHALETEKQKCLKLGIDDYITKPFTIKDIKCILSKYF